MNVLCVSPGFPPNFAGFAVALREVGVTPLGLGDVPWDHLAPELRHALAEYYWVPDLGDYDAVMRGAAFLIHRHGRLDRVESFNEHWLQTDARLRCDFNVPGLRPDELGRLQSKVAMKALFAAAGVPAIPGEAVRDPDQVRAFVAREGLPVILKPDVGVGAGATWRVDTAAELEAALAGPLTGYVIERFVEGTIVSYDGFTDQDGEPAFVTSLEYGDGVMELVRERRTVHFVSLRDLPEDLADAGRRIVRAAGLRERFFHLELFRRPSGDLVALELNLRPPGGYIPEMMGLTCGTSVYRAYARLVATGSAPAPAVRVTNVAHVCRRDHRTYRRTHDEIVALAGPSLALQVRVPEIFSAAMGNALYLVADADLDRLRQTVAWMIEES